MRPIKSEPARILGGAGEDHRLLVQKKGKQPEQIELVLEYARAINRSPGQNSVSFQAPQAAVSRWKVRIPQAGREGESAPADRRHGSPAGGRQANPTRKPADETVILAFVGAAPTVQIDWTPKSEGATGLTALASVQSEQQVWIQEGFARARTTLAYAISRAELNQLALDVPAEFKVVNVFDPNVRQWSVEPPAAGEPTAEDHASNCSSRPRPRRPLSSNWRRSPARSSKSRRRRPPVVKALNVGRQQGFVVVQVGAGLRAEAAKTSGLLQVDANELPPAMRSAAWTFAYRYASVPFELELAVEEVAAADHGRFARRRPLGTGEAHARSDGGLHHRAGRRLQAGTRYSRGIRTPQVTGRRIALAPRPGTARRPRSIRITWKARRRTHLVVNLARKAMGRVGLQVRVAEGICTSRTCYRRPASRPISRCALPQAEPHGVEHSTGRLVSRPRKACGSTRPRPTACGRFRSRRRSKA